MIHVQNLNQKKKKKQKEFPKNLKSEKKKRGK